MRRGAARPPSDPPRRPGLYKVRGFIRNMEHRAHMSGNPGPGYQWKNNAPRTCLSGMQFAVPMNEKSRPTKCYSGTIGSKRDGERSDAPACVGGLDFPRPLRDGTFTGTFLPSRVILTFCPARIPISKGRPPCATRSRIHDIKNSTSLIVPKLRFGW